MRISDWSSDVCSSDLDRVIAGTLVTTEKKLAALTGSETDLRSLAIGKVPIPSRLETRHMALIGTTGSGTTTALRQLLAGIEARGEARSAERRVGKEGVSTCRSRGSPSHEKKKKNTKIAY